MWFTCLCPHCGLTLRLLPKLKDCKVMCPDCHKAFIAQPADRAALELAELTDEMPERGWLVVCPSCGHTELISDDGHCRVHCPYCASTLPIPAAASKPITKKKTS
jgi:ribosomal protein S27E